MGSPQPPLVMPQSSVSAFVAASSFTNLPLDVKLTILQQIDSFATLHSLEKALGAEVKDVVNKFRRGVHSAVARTEFAPVVDAVLAMRMLDVTATTADTVAIETETETNLAAMHKPVEIVPVPKLVEQLSSTVETGSGLLDAPETLGKLHTLNAAALGLAELYAAGKGRTLSTLELFRFKQAVFRCTTFFELYKESKTVNKSGSLASPQGNNDEEEEDDEEAYEDDTNDEEAKEKNKYRPRNTFLSKLPHQEVLEMDCVREFMQDLAERIASLVEDDIEEENSTTTVCQDQLACNLGEFGFGITATKASCPCSFSTNHINDSNDQNDDLTNTTNSNTTTATSCTLQTPHLAHSILLLGPIALFRLHAISQSQPEETQLLKAIIHTLVPTPNKRRDIFWDEVMPFWRDLRSVYDAVEGDSEELMIAKQQKMLRGFKSVEEVMCVKNYEFAVFEEGRLFA